MNVLNEKVRILRIQLEAEKRATNPNQVVIDKLENELNLCLERLNGN